MSLTERERVKSGLIGTVGFQKLKIACVIGVEEFERVIKQEIFVDLQVEYDISLCAKNDSIKQAVDYVQLSQICMQIAQEGKFQLIETYAYEVLTYMHKHFPITHSKIRVEKPSALSDAACSFVELEWSS